LVSNEADKKMIVQLNTPRLIFILLVIVSMGSCGSIERQGDNSGGKDTFVKIIINAEKIKDKEFGSKFIDSLKELFGNSFENVSVVSGHGSPKMEEIVVAPQKLTMRTVDPPGKDKFFHIIKVADSTIKVSANSTHRLYSISSKGEYNASIGERLPNLFIPTFLVEVHIWTAIANNKALDAVAVDLYAKVKSDFKAYADSVKVFKIAEAESLKEKQALPSDIAFTVRFSDTGGFLPNNARVNPFLS